MQDITEYQFNAPDWRVMVRSSKAKFAATDLANAAREYADGLGLFLDAANTLIGSEESGPNGGRVIRITSDLPGNQLYAALLKFDQGGVIELSLTARKEIAGASAEFERLLASARRTGHDATTAVSRALKAEGQGSQNYPAGPLQLNLTADYLAPSEFTLESTDGKERYTFGKAPAVELEATRGPVRGARLAEKLAQAVGEDGKVVKYEVAPLRRFSRGSATRSAIPETRGAVKGADSGTRAVDATDTVGKNLVTVRVEGEQASAEKAVELLRTLNSTK